MVAALTSRPREHPATHRITVIAVPRSRALTVRHRHAPTLRRGRTPPRAAAIPLRHAPTPGQAIAAVVVEAIAAEAAVAAEAIMVAVVAEAPTAAEAVVAGAAVAAAPMVEVEAPTAEALLLTVTTNLIANKMARPDIRGGPFSLSNPRRT